MNIGPAPNIGQAHGAPPNAVDKPGRIWDFPEIVDIQSGRTCASALQVPTGADAAAQLPERAVPDRRNPLGGLYLLGLRMRRRRGRLLKQGVVWSDLPCCWATT